MSLAIETSPEIRREAERLADIAKDKPEDLKAALETATIDQLDALAAVVEERNQPVSREASDTVRAKIERLKETMDIDARLNLLQDRVRLCRLALIKATPQKDDLGRTAKRWALWAWSWVEGAQDGILSKLPNGEFLKTLTSFLPSFGKKATMKMDIEDAVAKETLVGETVVFDDVTDDDIALFAAKQAKAKEAGTPLPALSVLVDRYLAAAREELRRAGAYDAPIVLTVAGLLSGEIEKRLETARTEDRIAKITESLALPTVSVLKLTDIAHFDAGVLELPVSELEGDTPKAGSRAEILTKVIPLIPNAEEISVVPAGPTKVEWKDGRAVVTLSLGNAVENVTQLNELLGRGKPEHVSRIAIATSDRNGFKTVRFGYEGDSGVLTVPNKPDVLDALIQHLHGLKIDDDEESWTFANGDFTSDASVPLSA